MAYKSLSGINSGGGGGSGVTFTDGVNTVSDATQLTVTGGTIGGATPDATLTITGGVSSVSNSNGTLTISPTTGDVIASLNTGHANTWTALQQFNDGDFALKGASSGTITLKAAAAAGSNTITFPAGTTDFSATGGTSQVVKQTSSGGALTVAQLAASDLSNGTTGSGAVVLATGPTMSNPIVGTQSSSDNSTKAASTAYVTTAITNALNGLDWKPAVGYATTANVVGTNVAGVFTYTATGVDTIDGHQLALNDVVLFKNQTTGADNGVWVVTTAGAIGIAGVLTRRSDYNTAADIHDGDTFFVQNGTVNGGTAWVQTDVVTTINVDPLAFSQVAGPGTYTAGTGLTLTGNQFSLTNPVTVSLGGTGLATLTAHAVMLGEGTSNVAFATIGTAGRLLIDQGSGADPAFIAMSSDATIAANGALTIANNAITSVKINANAVTFAKIQTSTANSLLGFDGSGNAADITLTTTGTSGAATISGGVLNIPQYSSSGGTNLGLVYAIASGNLIM